MFIDPKTELDAHARQVRRFLLDAFEAAAQEDWEIVEDHITGVRIHLGEIRALQEKLSDSD